MQPSTAVWKLCLKPAVAAWINMFVSFPSLLSNASHLCSPMVTEMRMKLPGALACLIVLFASCLGQ